MARTIQMVPVVNLVPRTDQPRQYFDEKATAELAASMRRQGFIGQITVRPLADGRFEILAGHRRRLAALKAGLTEIPCVVEDLNEQQAREFVLLDNLNRCDMLPWEEGSGYAELVAGGLSLPDVAAKAGKSIGLVEGRITIHRQAGKALREAHLHKDIGLQALEALCLLPDRILSPVRCSHCKVINAEGTRTCLACQADLSGEFVCPVGNPQDAATRLCRRKQNGQVEEIIARVKEAYGLADKPVQTSLGLDDVQITEETVKVRTTIERMLEEVSKLRDRAVRNLTKLGEYDGNTKAAIRQQAEVAIKTLRRVQEAAA